MKHTQATQPRRTENALIIFVLIIGLAGLLMAFRGQASSQNRQMRVSFETETAALDKPANRLLHIQGDLEVGTPIQFQVQPAASASGLVIDFGNGVTKRVEKDSFSFTYNQADLYRIQVRDLQGRIVENHELHIAPQKLAIR